MGRSPGISSLVTYTEIYFSTGFTGLLFKQFFIVVLGALALVWKSARAEQGFEAFYTNVEESYGIEGRRRVESWVAWMGRELAREDASAQERLKNANDYFNSIPWVEDQQHWGVSDYWATPVEMLGSNGGDCEDYAVAKYFSLSETRFDKNKLRIAYVKSLTLNQAHMVLVYYPSPEAEPLVLDNINKSILPASQRKDLVPIYSFNGDSIWLAKKKEKKLGTSSESGLPKWRDLKRRMRDFDDMSRKRYQADR